MNSRPKIIVIAGPTASGKSALGVSLAKKFSGEIVSADSRQVYRGMDLGTGKVSKKEMAGIPHFLLDVASPHRTYSVARYQKDAGRAIEKIRRRQHLPFLVGGTGLYLRAVTDGLILPEVPPNAALRQKLEKMTTQELYSRLRRADPLRARQIDARNPRRLVRALEIVAALGRVPALKTTAPYDALFLGIATDFNLLRQKISTRLKARLKRGMVAEIKKLHAAGLSWKKLEAFGLEYRFVSRYLQGKISQAEMLTQLETAIFRYAKRQLTWFKKEKRIHWIKDEQEAQRLITKFLAQSQTETN